jgi:hypothetical protein
MGLVNSNVKLLQDIPVSGNSMAPSFGKNLLPSYQFVEVIPQGLVHDGDLMKAIFGWVFNNSICNK